MVLNGIYLTPVEQSYKEIEVISSLNKNLVARTPNLGAPGDRAPVRQQPC